MQMDLGLFGKGGGRRVVLDANRATGPAGVILKKRRLEQGRLPSVEVVKESFFRLDLFSAQHAFHACTLLFLCACATSHTLKAIEDSKFQNSERTEASGEKHEGPWTERIYTFAAPEEVMPSEPELRRTAGPASLPGVAVAQGVAGEPAHGPLLSLTVREHGPSGESWQASGTGQSLAEKHVAIKTEDKAAPSSGCALGLGFWLAVGLGLLAFGGWVWLKRSLP